MPLARKSTSPKLRFQPKPSFSVMASFSEGKFGPKGPNSDRVVSIPGKFDAVFDGAGPEGEHAAELMAITLHTLNPEADVRECMDVLCRAMLLTFGETKPGDRMPACTAVILSHHHAKVFLAGDAKAVLVGPDHHEVHSRSEEFAWERTLAEIRIQHNRNFLANRGWDEDKLFDFDPGWELVRPFAQEQHAMANKVGGYSVLCAEAMPDEMLWEMSVPASFDLAVLVTDGYQVDGMGRDDFLSVDSLDLDHSTKVSFDPACMNTVVGLKGLQRDAYTGELSSSPDDRSALFVRIF